MQDEVINLGAMAKEQKRNAKKRAAIESKARLEGDKARRSRSFKVKFYGSLFIVVSITMGTYWFANNYKLQNPVLLSTRPFYAKREVEKVFVPVVMGEETVAGTKISTHEEKVAYIRGSKYPAIIAGVWFRESTNGKNNDGHHIYCDEVGYSNEFGFGVYGDTRNCFGSFEESVDAVVAWFDGQLKNLSLDQALCHYNTGTASDECDYIHAYRADEARVWTELTK